MAAEHLDALAELERRCFSVPWSRNALAEELENPSACFLVAVEGGEILGYGGMHCACGQGYADNIAVFPMHRRKGVGRAIVTALVEEVRRRQGEFLSLEVRPSNVAAVALYGSLGFEVAGRRRNFYSSPLEDGLIMTKKL